MNSSQGGRPSRPAYIHELDDWPDFHWNEEVIKQTLGRVSQLQKQIVADAANMGRAAATRTTVRNLTNSAVASSRIEEEYPNRNAGRAAIRRRIVAAPPRTDQGERDEPGIAVVTADTATNRSAPLTADRLHHWHRLLFPGPNRANFTVGRWRDDQLGRMHVVSATSAGRTIVHFEAPPAERLEAEMTAFLDWFNQPETEPNLHKAAIAHLWFVTVHPYDDGNGRIARAIADLALSCCDSTDTRLYSMSAEILRQRRRYYRALQVTQSPGLHEHHRLDALVPRLPERRHDPKLNDGPRRDSKQPSNIVKS